MSGLDLESPLEGGIDLHYRGMRASSAFQPIYANRGRSLLAFEALLRVHDEASAPMSPPAAFARADRDGDVVRFDRLCRTLHLRNSIALPSDTLVFVNVNPELLAATRRRGFDQLLDRLGIPARRIVLELLETSVRDESRLAAAVQRYRALGYRFAVDDFGMRHSNLARVRRIEPDFVKLDRSLLRDATTSPRRATELVALVDLFHDLGSEVIVEGIETEEEESLAVATGADYLQGFRLGLPLPVRFWSARPKDSRVAPAIGRATSTRALPSTPAVRAAS